MCRLQCRVSVRKQKADLRNYRYVCGITSIHYLSRNCHKTGFTGQPYLTPFMGSLKLTFLEDESWEVVALEAVGEGFLARTRIFEEGST